MSDDIEKAIEKAAEELASKPEKLPKETLAGDILKAVIGEIP